MEGGERREGGRRRPGHSIDILLYLFHCMHCRINAAGPLVLAVAILSFQDWFSGDKKGNTLNILDLIH